MILQVHRSGGVGSSRRLEIEDCKRRGSLMTIPSLSSLLNGSAYPLASGNASGSTASSANSTTVGDQLLAALGRLQSTGSTTDALLQDLVSLSPTTLGQSTAAPQLYNAQGLLQQISAAAALNDPLLQPDPTTSTASTIDPTGLMALFSQGSNPAVGGNSLNAVVAALTSAQSSSATSGAASTAASSPTATATASPSLVQLIQQDPALAGALEQSQLDESVISML
jgi:hypothetical protein